MVYDLVVGRYATNGEVVRGWRGGREVLEDRRATRERRPEIMWPEEQNNRGQGRTGTSLTMMCLRRWLLYRTVCLVSLQLDSLVVGPPAAQEGSLNTISHEGWCNQYLT